MVTGLTENKTYYYRVKAVNCGGTTYGSAVPFKTVPTQVTDASGNVYNVIQIATQFWIKENLKTTKSNDGANILNETGSWDNQITSAYCWYLNDITYKSLYGALYNWYAVLTGKLCPTGWHVPTDENWTKLINYVGGESVAGGKLKEVGFDHWNTPNTGASNTYNFTALPGGFKTSIITKITFLGLGQSGYYWSSTEYNAGNAYYRRMNYNSSAVEHSNLYKWMGMSVRCIKD